MFDTEADGRGRRLYIGGELAAEHTKERPFAALLRPEKQGKALGRTVKARAAGTEVIPLSEVSEEPDGALRFSGEGHSLLVRLSPCEGGARLFFEGEEGGAYRFSLPAFEGEAVFGGGEQYRKLDLRGEKVSNFVSEHITAPVLAEKALLPKALYKEKEHSGIGSYSPMPVFATDRGRLMLFDTSYDGESYFGEDAYSFSFDGCPESLTLLKAESYEKLAGLLALRIPNRQYLPDWCFDGMILGAQGGTGEVLDKVFAMQDAGAKICGVWCQDWCGEKRTALGKQVLWNWEADTGLYTDLKNLIAKLDSRGVRFLSYINPYLVKGGRLYELCREKGLLITRKDGGVYHIRSTTFDAGMLDLTDPEAVRFIKDELIKKNMLDLGISGWMADFGEYLPLDCVLKDGDPAALHDLWPLLWAKINREAIEEYGAKDAFFFTRSGYLGIQTYAPTMWNGDQHTDFTKDYGLPCVMPASFSLGFSGAPMVHSDTGGFFSLGKLKRDDELLIRWMEMNCFSLLMRSHETIRPRANSQPYDEKVLPYAAGLTRVHAALKPYISSCAKLASKGVPALRPDFWEDMSFKKSRDPYSYYLGSDLFVCPVIERGKTERKVNLPAGSWVHFWTGEEFEGKTSFDIPAPLGRIPVFCRQDSDFTPVFRAAAEEAMDPR
ncbi:MAG: alpha-glucosidase [Firmicutes bacterium]|nr:alpha-glucosidase [Bacillota bacterium]